MEQAAKLGVRVHEGRWPYLVSSQDTQAGVRRMLSLGGSITLLLWQQWEWTPPAPQQCWCCAPRACLVLEPQIYLHKQPLLFTGDELLSLTILGLCLIS